MNRSTVRQLPSKCEYVEWARLATVPFLVLYLQCDENSTFNNHALYLGLPCCKEDYNGCPNIPSSLIFQRSTKETFSVSTQLSSTKLTQNGKQLILQNCPGQQGFWKREIRWVCLYSVSCTKILLCYNLIICVLFFY